VNASTRSPAQDQDEPSDGTESQTYERKSLPRHGTDEDTTSSVRSKEIRPYERARSSQVNGKLYATKGNNTTQTQVSEDERQDSHDDSDANLEEPPTAVRRTAKRTNGPNALKSPSKKRSRIRRPEKSKKSIPAASRRSGVQSLNDGSSDDGSDS